jgi:hypothetical protein
VAAYFFNFFQLFKKKKKNYEIYFMQLFNADAKIFLNFLKLFFGHKKLKKPPQKVAYLSRNFVVSEIFLLLPNSLNGRIHVPKFGLERNCI